MFTEKWAYQMWRDSEGLCASQTHTVPAQIRTVVLRVELS